MIELDNEEAVERVRLVRVSPVFGFADIRLPAVNLHDLRIEVDHRGELRFTPPVRNDARGRAWPAYSLQPGTREEIHAAIAALWAGPGSAR
jgi:hypothetical protein